MILTKQAKEDFLKYLHKGWPIHRASTEKWFEALYESFQLSLVTDWFDSVNINIHTDTTEVYYVGKIYNTSLKEPDYNNIYYHNISRHEVIRDLIEKANEIYNKNNL